MESDPTTRQEDQSREKGQSLVEFAISLVLLVILVSGIVDLGRGKRMLVRGGAYDATYQITVPRNMAGGSEQPLH